MYFPHRAPIALVELVPPGHRYSPTNAVPAVPFTHDGFHTVLIQLVAHNHTTGTDLTRDFISFFAPNCSTFHRQQAKIPAARRESWTLTYASPDLTFGPPPLSPHYSPLVPRS